MGVEAEEGMPGEVRGQLSCKREIRINWHWPSHMFSDRETHGFRVKTWSIDWIRSNGEKCRAESRIGKRDYPHSITYNIGEEMRLKLGSFARAILLQFRFPWVELEAMGGKIISGWYQVGTDLKHHCRGLSSAHRVKLIFPRKHPGVRSWGLT